MENGHTQKSWKFKIFWKRNGKVIEKSWDFSNAYHESCRRSSDNCICIVISRDLAIFFPFMFKIPNRNVRQASNHLFDSSVSV